eukprot:5906803-Pyramimonas_sp.AAC.3
MAPKKRTRSGSPVRPWDFDSGDSDVGAHRQSEEQVVAGEALIEELISMYLMGTRMTAKSFCTLCWHAKNAGVKQAERFSFRLGAPSGHYQRKLDNALGFK